MQVAIIMTQLNVHILHVDKPVDLCDGEDFLNVVASIENADFDTLITNRRNQPQNSAGNEPNAGEVESEMFAIVVID